MLVTHPRYRSAVSIAVAAAIVGSLSAGMATAAEASDELEEIVVTATRRSETLSRVPISVAAMNQDQMDDRGLKAIDDLSRFTPGLQIDRLGNGSNNISIRGISSGAGSGTTGVYIDETPIQVRALAYSSGTIFPALFDLERVEVLRGPQGTLFGAGSEGGTVRFIQTAPNLDRTSAYARAELSTTDGGDPSYEAGAAFGAPIVEGSSGFRVSAFYREEGGYIDGVSGTPVVLDPTGNAGPASLTFSNVRVTRKNTNSSTTFGARGALQFGLGENVRVTPSVTYQKSERNDGFDGWWSALSSGGQYARPVFSAGAATPTSRFTSLASPDKDSGEDSFVLPSLLLEWDAGPVSVTSNTSWFDRDFSQNFDFTSYYLWFYAQVPGSYPRDGDKASSLYENTQKNFVQEVRVQSSDQDARFTWQAGAFYINAKQGGQQRIGQNFLEKSPNVGLFFLPPFLHAVDGGDPFGPGSTAFRNWFGVNPVADSILWSIDFNSKDTQLAGFAEGTFAVTEKLKLTAGLRVSDNKVDFDAAYASPENNQNPTWGGLLPVLPAAYSAVAVKTSESATTPRFSASYQMNEDNLFYATAAKGFRPPGASQLLPPACADDLRTFGYVDGSGNPDQPLRFGSDSVWSYEVGSKNKLFGGALTLDGSVYQIKWKNIQTSIFLPNCAEGFTTNLSDATSRGFDVALQARPTTDLLLTANVGFNKSTFDADGISPGGVTIARKGGFVPGSPPPWVYSVSAQYDFRLFEGRKFFVRADLTHNSEERRIGQTDSSSPNYNPDLSPIPSYSLLSARLGMDLLGAEVSLFASNLTNASPNLALANRSPFNGLNRYLWTNQTVRPRMIGVFASYRY